MSPSRGSHPALPGALWAVAAGLSACVPLGPPTPSVRYELQAVFEGQPVAGPGPALVVAPPTAAPGFDGLRIVYVKRSHQLDVFTRNEWVDTPARMLAPLLVRALERSGAFASVAAAHSAAAGGLRLETEILRLQQEFTEHPSQVRLTARVQLTEMPSRRVLGTREVEAVEVAPSDDPYGGVVAANSAVRRVLEDIVAFCGERVAARLSGFVDSKDVVERAGEVAGRVSCVREVKNDLVVKWRPRSWGPGSAAVRGGVGAQHLREEADEPDHDPDHRSR